MRPLVPVAGLLAANLISGIGNAITMLAIPWFVLVTTGSASRAGIAVAAGAIPIVIAGIFGGAVVDRLGYKPSSIVADLASGLTVMAIPLLHATVGLAFWQLLALVFLGALLDVPGVTARQSLFPELVEEAGIQLERANGVYAITHRISGLLGPPLAGILIAFFGASNALWIDAATFAASALIFAALVPAREASQPPALSGGLAGYFSEIREGFAFLRNDALLLWLVIVIAIGSLLAEPLYGVVLPVYAGEVLGGSVDLGLAFAALAAGSIAGNVLYLLVGPRVPRRIILITGIGVRALTFWVLLALPPLWVVAASIFVNAMFLEPLNPLIMTVFQERVPAGMRGRVFGAASALSASTLPIGLFGYGILIDTAGLHNALIALAIANLAMPLAVILAPALRGIERPKPIAVGIPPGAPLEK